MVAKWFFFENAFNFVREWKRFRTCKYLKNTKKESNLPADRNEGNGSLRSRQAVLLAFQLESGETQLHHVKNSQMSVEISNMQINASLYVSHSDHEKAQDQNSVMRPFRSKVFLTEESKAQASDRHDTVQHLEISHLHKLQEIESSLRFASLALAGQKIAYSWSISKGHD